MYDSTTTLSSFNVLKKVMVKQMESFYVVDLDKSMKDLEKLIQNGNINLNFNKILIQCTCNFEMYNDTLKKQLIFLK